MEKSVEKPIFGSTLLVTGCCIGAGMLGLPLVCQPCGFLGSLLPLMIGWAYMYLSGLMLLEVHSTVDSKLTLLNLLEVVLGKRMKQLGAFLFFFLFSSILTAYLNAFSMITKHAVDNFFNIHSPQLLSLSCICAGLIALTISGIKKIDFVNRVFVMLMLLFYVMLIFFGAPQVKAENLGYFSFKSTQIVLAIPIFIISFGFQNLIPLISEYVNHHARSVKKALFFGTLLAFLVYFIWNYIILGMLSPTVELSSIHALFTGTGNFAGTCISGFGLLAIITSLITVAFSFSNFVSHPLDSGARKITKSLAVIAIPALLALIDPGLFLLPLHIAGGIAAVSLFGLLPVAMIWKLRYRQGLDSNSVFPFGKTALIVYSCFSISVIALEIAHVCKLF